MAILAHQGLHPAGEFRKTHETYTRNFDCYRRPFHKGTAGDLTPDQRACVNFPERSPCEQTFASAHPAPPPAFPLGPSTLYNAAKKQPREGPCRKQAGISYRYVNRFYTLPRPPSLPTINTCCEGSRDQPGPPPTGLALLVMPFLPPLVRVRAFGLSPSVDNTACRADMLVPPSPNTPRPPVARFSAHPRPHAMVDSAGER